MADFTTSNTTKSAVRRLAAPLADVTAFDNIVQGVVTNNPFQCVGYNSGGVDHPPVERSRQGYTARVIYQDSDAKTIALITIRAPTIAAFTNATNQIVGNNAIALALGGTPVRDSTNERFAATLRCHDANGEIYFVNFRPGAGDPYLVLGRGNPEQGRDVGGYGRGAWVIWKRMMNKRGGGFPCPLHLSQKIVDGGDSACPPGPPLRLAMREALPFRALSQIGVAKAAGMKLPRASR